MFWLRIMMLAELALVARRHLTKLSFDEHRRLASLVRKSHGRPDKNLSVKERDEFVAMVRKLEPSQFGKAAFGAVKSPSRNPLRRG